MSQNMPLLGRVRHGGASERYNDLADELPMEWRGRGSGCEGHTTSPKRISRHH